MNDFLEDKKIFKTVFEGEFITVKVELTEDSDKDNTVKYVRDIK